MTYDIKVWTQREVKSQNMEYLCKLMYCKNFDGGYDITIVTYLLPDLYLPKMETALFVAPEFNRLSRACAV